MKKMLLLILSCLLLANVSYAVVDTSPNSMGFYFDLNADIFETTGTPFSTTVIYVILTNPSFDSLIGYQFAYQVVGNHMISSTTLHGIGSIDTGYYAGNHIVWLGAPLSTSPATLLATLKVLVMDQLPISFRLHGTTPNAFPETDLPAVSLPGGVNMSTGTSSYGSEPLINAYINGSGVVETEGASWDQVKSLYR